MSDNTAGRCQARRPGRLLEAACKRCPRGMAVTYRLPQAGGALQNPAYRLADVFENEGFGATRRTPRQFGGLFCWACEFGTCSGAHNPFRADPVSARLSPFREGLTRAHALPNSNSSVRRCSLEGRDSVEPAELLGPQRAMLARAYRSRIRRDHCDGFRLPV